MDIQIREVQNGGSKDFSRRNFQVKGGEYENCAYNDGGVPTSYVMVAYQEAETTGIVLGFASQEDSVYRDFSAAGREVRWLEYLQEKAVKLAVKKGLDPKVTIVDIGVCDPRLTLHGGVTC